MINLIELVRDPQWKVFFKNEAKNNKYFLNLEEDLTKEYEKAQEKKYNIFPPKKEIFAALNGCPPDKVKAVILGQDPFHGKNQAHGLSFSVQKGISIPPSLRNIFKELKNDLNIDAPNHGCLQSWLDQGVLLLNASLTVIEGQPNSHKDLGWHKLTDSILEYLNSTHQPKVFILWGAFARQKKNLIDKNKHLILESAHPSPYSADNGFFGSKPFSKANEFLRKNNIQEIDWKIQ